jgi:SAM-dependent methyltransferase
MNESWMLDELAHAGPEHLDPSFVAGYDRKQAFDPGEDLALLRAHGLGSESTLVDLGAGSGRLVLAAAPYCRRAVAVDVSPAMLAHLRDQAARAGITNLEVVQAGFLSHEHSGSPADFVYTRNALHQLPDFWKGIALDRIARMLRPRGVLILRDLIYDFQPSEADAVLDRWLDGAAEDPTKGYTREDFAEHIRTEYSTYRWLFDPMLAVAGFEIVESSFRRRVYGAYTCIRSQGSTLSTSGTRSKSLSYE